MSAIKMLSRLLEESGARILFGLEAQGHIPKVETMLARGATWAEIGSAIGWHGPTVEQHYGWHVQRKAQPQGVDRG